MHVVAATLDRQSVVADLQKRILQADQRAVEVHAQLFEAAGEWCFDLLGKIPCARAAEAGGKLADGEIDLAVESTLFRVVAGAFGIGLGTLLFAFGFDTDLGQGIFPENAERPGHVADLVAAGTAVDRGIERTVSEAAHGGGDLADRAFQRQHQRAAGQKRDQDTDDGCENGHLIGLVAFNRSRGFLAFRKRRQLSPDVIDLGSRGAELRLAGRTAINKCCAVRLHLFRHRLHGNDEIVEERQIAG